MPVYAYQSSKTLRGFGQCETQFLPLHVTCGVERLTSQTGLRATRGHWQDTQVRIQPNARYYACRNTKNKLSMPLKVIPNTPRCAKCR
eukprot:1433362-Pleurochrysis_carterae.AAC.2